MADFNGNKSYVDFDYSLRSTNDAQALITQMRKKRLARVEKAMRHRPVVLPLRYALPVPAQVNPITAQTPKLDFDVEIVGAISDLPDVALNMRPVTSEKSFALVGTSPVQYARAHDFAGWSPTSAPVGAFKGVYYWPVSYSLLDPDRLIVDVIKNTATAAATNNYFCLVGHKIYDRTAQEAQLSAADRKRLIDLIASRRKPEPRWLTMPVQFAGGGAAAGDVATGMLTPSQDEPLLIRGVRTSLTRSTISIAREGEAPWMTRPAPVWSIAASQTNSKEQYTYFETPIYLPAKKSLAADFVNTLADGSGTFDGNGQLTFFAETV